MTSIFTLNRVAGVPTPQIAHSVSTCLLFFRSPTEKLPRIKQQLEIPLEGQLKGCFSSHRKVHGTRKSRIVTKGGKMSTINKLRALLLNLYFSNWTLKQKDGNTVLFPCKMK